MKVLVDLAKASPDTVGEYFREACFTDKGLGCYSNFDVKDNWKPVPITRDVEELLQLYPEEGLTVCAYKDDVTGTIAAWYWDGDGVLAFKLPNGRVVINTDCKKDYYWKDRNA